MPIDIPDLTGQTAYFSGEHLSRRLNASSIPKEVKRLQQEFREGRKQLFGRIEWDAPVSDFLEAHTALVDGILKEIYRISCWFADREVRRTLNSTITIVATGGYGRKELNPYSDIDIAFLPPDEQDPWVEAFVHAAFRLVMDVFLSLRDIHVGYAFRPLKEASSWDVPTKTALLDLRFLSGDRILAGRMQSRIRELLSPLDIMLETPSAKGRSLQENPSIYSLEPNLKEGPGSLRVLHRARWIFKLLADTKDDAIELVLKSRAGLSARQIQEVREAADWFLKARTWLHLRARRASDVLINNYQDQIAREMQDCSARQWLSLHIAHAESFERFRDAAVRTLMRGPYRINGCLLENGVLDIQDEGAISDSAVSLFHNSQRYSIPLNLKALKQLEDSRRQILDDTEASGEEVFVFNGILRESRDIALTLRALVRFGLIDRFIPDFSRLMRHAPPESSHSYTVGEHSIRIIEHLEDLRLNREPANRRFAELLAQCSHFDMLCLAALLHDLGKLLPSKDHAESSAELAKSTSTRLNLTPEKKEILDILVRHHLLLVRTARLQDLQSFNVLQMVADRVPDIDLLRHLFVFTYVDTLAVSEAYWTSMDDRNLEDLYKRMQDFYSGVDLEDDEGTSLENKISLVRKKLVAIHSSKSDTAVLKHCDAMPAGYVLNTPLGEISFHIQLLERLEEERVVIDIYNHPGDDHSVLTICTYDDPQPGILSKMAGVLYGCGANIYSAQAYTMERKVPVVLDTLWIQSNGMQISENKARRIRKSLKAVLSNTTTVDQFLADIGKVPPEHIDLDKIILRNDLSREHTIVNVLARDLQGLLFLVARCLSRSGLQIHSAKVATWSGKGEHNFYISAPEGGQIPENDLPQWREKLALILQGKTESDTVE